MVIFISCPQIQDLQWYSVLPYGSILRNNFCLQIINSKCKLWLTYLVNQNMSIHLSQSVFPHQTSILFLTLPFPNRIHLTLQSPKNSIFPDLVTPPFWVLLGFYSSLLLIQYWNDKRELQWPTGKDSSPEWTGMRGR